MNMDAAAFVAGPELVDALRQHASPVVCDGDRVLFNQGDAPDGLYIFRNGKVELSMRSGAGDVVMSMPALEDSLLGLPGLIGNMPYSLSALAMAGSNVSYLSRDALNRLRGTYRPHGADGELISVTGIPRESAHHLG